MDTSTAHFHSIVDALKFAAHFTNKGILSYPPKNISNPAAAQWLSYEELLCQAEANADRLRQPLPTREALPLGSVVLVYFEDAIDSIVWYWSVLLAGAIPAMSSPGLLSQNSMDLRKHIDHLSTLLGRPMCLTRRSLLQPFLEHSGIDACAVEDILTDPSVSSKVLRDSRSKKRKASLAAIVAIRNAKKKKLLSDGHDGFVNMRSELRKEKFEKQLREGVSNRNHHQPKHSEIAALMLTSGTSGTSKAVILTHRQVLTAFRWKQEVANLDHPDSPFLSWINTDHVANLVHSHLFAIISSVSQISVTARDVLEEPVQFLDLLSRHRVSRTFAPNFLFATLWRQLEAGKTSALDEDANIEALYSHTGGEASIVQVCAGLQSIISEYGASKNVFNLSFGITEACAGCTSNTNCTSYDIKSLKFASLGTPLPGIRMRIISISPNSKGDGSLVEARVGERSHLEMEGEVVLKGYCNSRKASPEALTTDGWFTTGDLAYLDDCGTIRLDGQTKGMIGINGVKYRPFELDVILEQANIPGATPSYFRTFSTRDATVNTEVVVVTYLPSFDESDDHARSETRNSIIQVVSTHVRSRPQVLPLREKDFKNSTLGIISRAKIKTAWENGVFASHRSLNEAAIKRCRQKAGGDPETSEEIIILGLIRDQLELGADQELFVNDSILAIGATSMDIMALMSRINRTMAPPKPVELIDLLNNTTARGIAACVAAKDQAKQEYHPVVVLQPQGTKTPLWLVHPGVGECLVFVNMAQYFTDRPIYAFRIKGLTKGEASFENLSEMFQIYHASIKEAQPKGPYAVAGYSFGSMVAFELAKMLEAEGEDVRYCGVWNLPPRIKSHTRGVLWEECLMHLFYFIELMSEATVYSHKDAVTGLERGGKRREAIEYLRPLCDQNRWKILGLSVDDYEQWVSVAAHNQSLAINHEPSGKVKCIDVFVANDIGAKEREDWVKKGLMAWGDFVKEDFQLHEVQGAHWNMLNSAWEDVSCFAETLRGVLAKRGL